jgi:hypothetical protein
LSDIVQCLGSATEQEARLELERLGNEQLDDVHVYWRGEAL